MGREVIEGGHNAHLWTNPERAELHLIMAELDLERDQVVALVHRLNPSWLASKYNAIWKHLADVWAGRFRESHSKEWRTIARPYLAKGHKKRKPNLTPYTQGELDEYWRIRCNVHAAAASLDLTPLAFKSGTASLEMGGPQLGNQPPLAPLPHNASLPTFSTPAQSTAAAPYYGSSNATNSPAATTHPLKRRATAHEEQPRKTRKPRPAHGVIYYESRGESDGEKGETEDGTGAESNDLKQSSDVHSSRMPYNAASEKSHVGAQHGRSGEIGGSNALPQVNVGGEDEQEYDEEPNGNEESAAKHAEPFDTASGAQGATAQSLGRFDRNTGLTFFHRIPDTPETEENDERVNYGSVSTKMGKSLPSKGQPTKSRHGLTAISDMFSVPGSKNRVVQEGAPAQVLGPSTEPRSPSVIANPADPKPATSNVGILTMSRDSTYNPKYKAPGTYRIYECELLNRLHAPPSTWSVFVPPTQRTALSQRVESDRQPKSSEVSNDHQSYSERAVVDESFSKYGSGPAIDESGPEPDWEFYLNDTE